CGAIGSAREWHSRGYGFDPRQLHFTPVRQLATTHPPVRGGLAVHSAAAQAALTVHQTAEGSVSCRNNPKRRRAGPGDRKEEDRGATAASRGPCRSSRGGSPSPPPSRRRRGTINRHRRRASPPTPRIGRCTTTTWPARATTSASGRWARTTS